MDLFIISNDLQVVVLHYVLGFGIILDRCNVEYAVVVIWN